jgi:6-phosphogluconolactonase (cycloisomerase 2 family)
MAAHRELPGPFRGLDLNQQAGCGPQELAIDPSVKFLFVSCAGLSEIARFGIDSASRDLTPLPPFSTANSRPPRGIAIDASGSYLYSAWNMQNKAGAAAIETNGTLTAVSGTPSTGRGPIGVALS